MSDYADNRTRVDRYTALRAALWSQRSSFDSHWKELGNFFLPRRTRFFAGDRNRGDKRNTNIIDSSAGFAARTLQSGLHAGLTSPARPWFKLSTPDPKLAEDQLVKEWLHTVTQRMQVVFGGTNLYNTLPIVYGDMGVFGTSAMAILEDTRDLFRCYAYPLGSYALGLDARGLATTFVRDYELSVRQVVEQFGVPTGTREIDWSLISPEVKASWDRGDYEANVELCWVVTPNEEHEPGKLEARYLPWASCHFETGRTDRFLRESGFQTFPILAPRWSITGEDTYGTDCPGMTALGDVKQLQAMTRDEAKAVKKLLDPPLKGAPELRNQKTSLLPGDITYVREPQHGLSPIHETRIDLAHLGLLIERVTYRIQRAFYEDLFLMLATADARMGADRPTAREVDERHEEKLLALGPVLERTKDELLDPLIDRTFGMMQTAGLLPEAPESLQGVNLRVEYISIMAQAQKLVGVVGQDRFFASIVPLMEAFPEVRHKVDIFRGIDAYGEMLDVDPRIVRTTEDAMARLQGEQQAQAEQAAAEQAKLAAGALKDAGSTPMGTGSALDRMVDGAQTVQ